MGRSLSRLVVRVASVVVGAGVGRLAGWATADQPDIRADEVWSAYNQDAHYCSVNAKWAGPRLPEPRDSSRADGPRDVNVAARAATRQLVESSPTVHYGGLTINYPQDGTLFPPEIAAPTFRWADANAESDAWVVAIDFADKADRLSYTIGESRWTPTAIDWETIKARSSEAAAKVTVRGLKRSEPDRILSAGAVSIMTSTDEVGAPLFYREVNLPFIDAVKDPSTIRWRFGPISSPGPPPIVLENLPVCGNCHSFSADGRVLGMDVDYANDKGSYALAEVKQHMVLAGADVITWSNYRRDDHEPTFGLLSQVSPDGRYAISTVKDRSVFVPRPDLAFSQLFFPIRGILAVYDRQTGMFRALPGADNPNLVQSNPTWSPDGKYLVFARSEAHRLERDRGSVLLSQEECREFLEEGKTFLFDLYRIPFNDGRGGEPVPLEGASHNGMSNYFPKYSPDGRWIVFCQARSFMLLQPDSELYIIPAEGGQARRLERNTPRMNSWHSWSPNGKWLVFSSKANSPYTQLMLTHIDEQGRSSPPVELAHLTAPDRAANIPEFVNTTPTAIASIREQFVDDVSYVRAGDTYLSADDVEGAIRQYAKALELNPANAIAHSNLGGIMVNKDMVADGVAHLLEAVRLDPKAAGPHYNLGMLRFRQGEIDEAIEHLSSAVQLDPEIATAHRVLGALLCARGALEEGFGHLTEAVRLAPSDAAAQYLLGKALVSRGRLDEAIGHLAQAVQFDPDDAAAHFDLGTTLFRRGRAEEAIAHLARAVQLDPGDPNKLRELAWVLATASDPRLRDGVKAVELAKRACELTGYRSIEPLDVLGVCHAEAGQFPEAIRAAEQALTLARAAGHEPIARAISARLELYRQSKPYRPPASP